VRRLHWRILIGVVVAIVASLWFRGTTSAEGLWHGFVAGGDPNIRSAPTTAAPIVGTLQTGNPIQIEAWVSGERVKGVNETWGEIAPGQYVYSAGLSKPLPAAPPSAPRTFAGHWIDANLSEQILTAYDGAQPVYWAVMSSGAPGGTSTDPGTYQILRRVPNETMRSSSLRFKVEIPYDLSNVLYTQYFTDYGAAIHDNWWKGPDSPFGVPTSHACLGLREADARFFWNWANVGTVLNVHN
jgi:hypothetical protein